MAWMSLEETTTKEVASTPPKVTPVTPVKPLPLMVTDVEGNGPKSIGIVSSDANLAPHVGHKIEVTGTAVPAKEAEADPKVPKAPHYMKLTSIKMISPMCP